MSTSTPTPTPTPTLPPAALAPGRTRPCAVVAAGTSRFLVLDVADLGAEQDRAALARDLLDGVKGLMGLGGEHYQANKVVVVEPAPSGRDLAFRFLQLDEATGRVYATMECSNAAPAAALFTLLHPTRGHRPRADTATRRSYSMLNLSTGQAVDLEAPAGAWWDGDWRIRFEELAPLGRQLGGGAEPFEVPSSDEGGSEPAQQQPIRGHLVDHGNVFVFAERAPAAMTSDLVARLAGVGDDLRRRRALPAGVTKVLPYQVSNVDGGVLRCATACFSSGQRHRSLPGSAAMALGAFLTAQGLAPVQLDQKLGHTDVELTHPSGRLDVRIYLRHPADPSSVCATSFLTPVRLLLDGVALT